MARNFLNFPTSSVVLALAFAAGALAQPTPAPPPTGVPVPAPPPGTQQICGPIVDIFDGSNGNILRACESGGSVSSSIIGGGFRAGFLNDMVRTDDGAIMLLMDDGSIIRNRFGITQSFATGRATAFLSASFDEVVVSRETGQPMTYFLNLDDSFFARPLFQEGVFPNNCTQVIHAKSGDLFCVDRNNGKISRSAAGLFRPARPAESQPYFKQEGVIFAREYRGGMLVLVQAQFQCPQPSPIPPNATVCFLAGSCKQTKPAQLLFVSGDQALVRVLPFDIAIDNLATFSVAGDTIYLVESQLNNDLIWQGDFISKLDLASGKKSVYISMDDFRNKFGFEQPELWIN